MCYIIRNLGSISASNDSIYFLHCTSLISNYLLCVFCLTVRWVEGVRANAVSVGTDGQVILVTDNGHLAIYSVDGQLIIDHSLPDDIQKPRHAVFSSTSGTFIVSYSSVNGVEHRYCRINQC